MSGYLLDTSVLITLGRLKDPRYALVRRWLDNQPDGEFFTCSIVIGELARGVAILPAGQRRRREEHWLHHTMMPAFPILDFDLAAALHWGNLMGEGQAGGVTPPNDDAKVAAIAAVRGLPSSPATFATSRAWACPAWTRPPRAAIGAAPAPDPDRG